MRYSALDMGRAKKADHDDDISDDEVEDDSDQGPDSDLDIDGSVHSSELGEIHVEDPNDEDCLEDPESSSEDEDYGSLHSEDFNYQEGVYGTVDEPESNIKTDNDNGEEGAWTEVETHCGSTRESWAPASRKRGLFPNGGYVPRIGGRSVASGLLPG